MKFFEGSTTQTQEIIPSHDMDFPQLMICSKIGFKTDALIEMGHNKEILSAMDQRIRVGNNHEFGAQSVWDNGTYSLNDLAINWIVVQGKPCSFCVYENYLLHWEGIRVEAGVVNPPTLQPASLLLSQRGRQLQQRTH